MRNKFCSDVFLSCFMKVLKVLWMKIYSEEMKLCTSSVDGMDFFEVIVGWMQHYFDTCRHWKFDIDNKNITFVFIMERMNKYSKNIICRLFNGKMDNFLPYCYFFQWISFECWSDWIHLLPIHKMVIEFFLPFSFVT